VHANEQHSAATVSCHSAAGLLRRCYTQNIDSLETAAGIPKDKVIPAHGNFDSASCIDCSASASMDDIRSSIEKCEV
jgi:NAD+-dependent protein deacetylase sirtuin 2